MFAKPAPDVAQASSLSGTAGVSPADSASKMLAGLTDKMSVPRVDDEPRYLR